MYSAVEEVGNLAQHSGSLQCTHSHQYAKEEQYSCHVDIPDSLRDTSLKRLPEMVLPYYDLSQQPHHTERNHHSHKRWHSCQSLKNRHEYQRCHAENQYNVTQPWIDSIIPRLHIAFCRSRSQHIIFYHQRCHISRNYGRDQTWNYQIGNQV